MGNSVSPGLGNSANHGLRDVGLAEPSKEVERSIASPALTNSKEINRKSRFPLPVPPKPYIGAQRGAVKFKATKWNMLQSRIRLRILWSRAVT